MMEETAEDEDYERLLADMRAATQELWEASVEAAAADPLKTQIPLAVYHAQKQPRFGRHNPEPITYTFWHAMIERGCNAWQARVVFDDPVRHYEGPVWTFTRFGMSQTSFPDGRTVYIGGEHEDHYDPDFCIYNDVIVIGLDGGVTIYGYPSDVFARTDFHSATVVGESIYMIGGLGYSPERCVGETPVYRLDTQAFHIEGVATGGTKPGWIFKHDTLYLPDSHCLQVTGGQIFEGESAQGTRVNQATYQLHLATFQWTSQAGS